MDEHENMRKIVIEDGKGEVDFVWVNDYREESWTLTLEESTKVSLYIAQLIQEREATGGSTGVYMAHDGEHPTAQMPVITDKPKDDDDNGS